MFSSNVYELSGPYAPYNNVVDSKNGQFRT